MSRIGNIRAALVTVLDAVAGIDQMLPYPPTNVDVEGTAWLDFDLIEVTDGQRTDDLHKLPLFVCVSLNSDIAGGMKATEPIIDAARIALRANQSLGINDIARVQVIQVQQGTWKVGDTPFVGFQMALLVKETYGVSFS